MVKYHIFVPHFRKQDLVLSLLKNVHDKRFLVYTKVFPMEIPTMLRLKYCTRVQCLFRGIRLVTALDQY